MSENMPENMSENMSESYIEVELTQQPIELYKLLKIANLVSGGGEAKVVISEGYVFLNGEVEYQKRKKIYHEDVIEFNGETLQLIINENPIADESTLIDTDFSSDLVHDNSNSASLLNETIQEVSIVPEKRKNKSRNKKSKANQKGSKQNESNQIRSNELTNKHEINEAPLPRKRKPISF